MKIDHELFKGVTGFILSVSLPLLDFLNPLIQLIGALLGLVLLVFSIKHKIAQYRNEKNIYNAFKKKK